jgi:hypothetical protein
MDVTAVGEAFLSHAGLKESDTVKIFALIAAARVFWEEDAAAEEGGSPQYAADMPAYNAILLGRHYDSLAVQLCMLGDRWFNDIDSLITRMAMGGKSFSGACQEFHKLPVYKHYFNAESFQAAGEMLLRRPSKQSKDAAAAYEKERDQAANAVTSGVLEVIDRALPLAGYKVMDGDRNSVIIRHSGSDADFEIKVIPIEQQGSDLSDRKISVTEALRKIGGMTFTQFRKEYEAELVPFVLQYMRERFGIQDRQDANQAYLIFNASAQFIKVYRRKRDFLYMDDLEKILKAEKLYGHSASSFFSRDRDFYDLSLMEQLKILSWTFDANGNLTGAHW